MKVSNPDNNIQFLNGGGEMGRLTREKDWSNSILGAPQCWKQSLRTALSIILHSKFPMFLFWGEKLICFYNDAYRPSLGKEGKHPSILGMKGEDAWPETWSVIKPLIDQVLAGGEASWSEDQLMPMYRNGKRQDLYWTFSHSPVFDESGKPAGVFVTCTETTEKVIVYNKLEESKDQLEFAIEAAELGTWDYNPLTKKFTSNARLKEWFGLAPEENIELTHAVNAMRESDRERVTDAIQKALDFSSGYNYDIEYNIVHPATQKETIVHAKGRAWFNDDKIAYRFNGTLEDITDKATAAYKIKHIEEFNRSILENSPDCVKIIDTEGRLQFMNVHGLCTLEIDDFADYKNKPWFELWGDDNKQTIVNALSNALRGETVQFQAFCPTAKGTPKWWDVMVSPVKEPGADKVTSIISVSRDISEQHFAIEKIKENEKLFNQLIYSSPSAIGILYGEDFVITIANEPIISIWGKGKEIIGKKYFEAMPELEEQGYQEIFAKVYKTGIAFNGVETPVHILQNGETTLKYYNFVLYPQRNINNEVTGIGIIATEVTTQAVLNNSLKESEQRYRELSTSLEEKVKERTAELQETNIDLAKMNRELQSFAYISSHDLQEPLRKIQTFATRIIEKEQDRLSESAKDQFQRMQSAAKRMQTLINDLLAYSRTSTVEREFETTDLSQIINEVKEDLKEDLNEKNAIVEATETCELNIIPFQFRQLMHNLIGNALKFSNEETPPRIKIKSTIDKGEKFIGQNLSPEQNYCHIIVADNGIGFEQQYSVKIFEVFQRLHGRDTYNGTGIGLSIVRRIVENHNGIITAQSELGKGARFDIYIPAT